MKLSTRLLILAAGGSYKKVKDPLPYAIAVGHILGLPPGNVPKDVQKRLDSIGHDAVDMPGLPDKIEVYVRAPVAADRGAYERKLTNPDHMPLHPPQEQALIRATVHGTTHDLYLLGNDVSHLDAFEETHFPVWPPRSVEGPEEVKEGLWSWLSDFQKELQNITMWAGGYRGQAELGIAIPGLEGAPHGEIEGFAEWLRKRLNFATSVGTNQHNNGIRLQMPISTFRLRKEDVLKALLILDAKTSGIVHPAAKDVAALYAAARAACEDHSSTIHCSMVSENGTSVALDFSSTVVPDSGNYAAAVMSHLLDDFLEDISKGRVSSEHVEDLDADNGEWKFRMEFSPRKRLSILTKALQDPEKASAFVSLMEDACIQEMSE